MSDDITDSSILIAAKIQRLERENKKLKKEADVAKRILFRMDRRRESLLRMVTHLRTAWEPENKNDTTEVEFKNNHDKFNEAIKKSLSDVEKNVEFCKERDKALESQIQQEVNIAITEEEAVLNRHKYKG